MELDNKVHQQITHLCASGDALAEKQEFEKAILEYEKAWALIPDPKTDWETAAWVLAAIGDAFFFLKEYGKASDHFQRALRINFASPFILLRLGQSLFEINQTERAEDFLMRAYMLKGKKIFDQEDGKYFRHMRRKFGL